MSDQPISIDTIIRGWYVVTMNKTRDIIRNGAVAIDKGSIVAVGKYADISPTYSAKYSHHWGTTHTRIRS
jgi:5-methylthioadenosine/S-adenosylhomocysteine deaminase